MELIEKAQPLTLSDLAGLDTLVSDAKGWKENSFPQALLFSGPPGTGKTSAAHVIARFMLEDDFGPMNFIESNASDDRGIDFIRNELKFSMRSKGIGVSRKVILLDEADGLTPQAQDAMRQLIEKHSRNAMLILTCNDMQKIRPAIRSRCKAYVFKPVSPEAGANRLQNLIPHEFATIDTYESFKELVELMNGDLRACIMFLDSIKVVEIEERVQMLYAMSEDDSVELAVEGDWLRLRQNLHGLLKAGQPLPHVLNGFYRNIYSHFESDEALDSIWNIMAVYGDLMVHKHTWPGDDYSYCDYMVAKMKQEVIQ
jgi:replication factor C small subunit